MIEVTKEKRYMLIDESDIAWGPYADYDEAIAAAKEMNSEVNEEESYFIAHFEVKLNFAMEMTRTYSI